MLIYSSYSRQCTRSNWLQLCFSLNGKICRSKITITPRRFCLLTWTAPRIKWRFFIPAILHFRMFWVPDSLFKDTSLWSPDAILALSSDLLPRSFSEVRCSLRFAFGMFSFSLHPTKTNRCYSIDFMWLLNSMNTFGIDSGTSPVSFNLSSSRRRETSEAHAVTIDEL